MLMIESSLLNDIGYIDEELDRREDQDFILRIVCEYEISIIYEPLTHKYTGEYDQLGSDYYAGKIANSRFMEKHKKLAAQMGMLNQMEVAFEFTLGRTALDNRNYSQARRHFTNTLKSDPFDKGHLIHFMIALGGPVTHYIGKAISSHL